MEIFIVLTLFLLAEFIVYLISKRSKIILSKSDLYPDITNNLIAKFQSFDPEIGWTNKKNSIVKEKSNLVEKVYTYDKYGARNYKNFNYSSDAIIATFGDSFCQCREVSDNETWQYYLSEKLEGNVLNYGVGNYGFDQALIRLKREFSRNKTEIVIMAITPYTITRITSIWKHFSEFENILAFKPRYIIEEGKLVFLKNLIQKKSELKNIENHKKWIEMYDDHYLYILQHIYEFPYLFSLAKKPEPFVRSIYKILSSLFFHLGLNGISSNLFQKYLLAEILYRKLLYNENKELFNKLVKKFKSYSEKNRFVPVFVFMPAMEDVKYYMKIRDNYYFDKNLFESNNILCFDFMEHLSKEYQSISQYFVDNVFGGHYSCFGNLMFSEYLFKKLADYNMVNEN